MSELKPYMAYDGSLGSGEGSALVFAHDSMEAKIIGYPTIRSWFDTEWIDIRVRLIKENVDYLLKEANPEKYAAGLAHTIESPKVCPRCELWGGGEFVDGHCDYCEGEEDL